METFTVEEKKDRFHVSEDLRKELAKDNEEDVLKRVVVSDEQQAVEEFEQGKKDMIEGEVDDEMKNAKDREMEGWGSWAGDGLAQPKAQIERIKRKREAKLKEKIKLRQDGKLKNVVINQQRDKKFKKYMVQKLPHPYTSVSQFEAVMKLPVSKERNSVQGFHRMIQPDFLVKAGKVIAPLKHKEGLSMETVEALVMNR